MRVMASWRNSRAMAAHDRGDVMAASRLYERAIASDPTWSTPWYNLGLLNKEQRDWPASLRCNQEAVLRDPLKEAAWWNLGIAATALSDWTEARRAWSAYGIELPEGTGEIRGDFGYTPIRLNPEHRHGDLLLHDGAPSGSRLLRGREVSVFDEIQVLTRSSHRTFGPTTNTGKPGFGCATCMPNDIVNLNFQQNAYYLEATLTRATTASSPKLLMISLP